MSKSQRLPTRARVKESDAWDLASLFVSDDEWLKALKQLETRIDGYEDFRGTLGKSVEKLADCLRFDSDLDRLAERLGVYAFLKTSEDQTNSSYQAMLARFQNVAARAGQLASFIRPEILALPDKKLRKFIASPSLAPFRVWLTRLLRYKPHTLSDSEEKLLAMQAEMSQAANQAFRQLLDSDMKFGDIEDETGRQVELGNATFQQLLNSPRRSVRKAAFHQYYEQFQAHKNTLAATLAGSVQKDIYYARARGYDSALSAALFPDHVPRTVYDNLIKAVHKHLPALHRYYELRRRKMKLRQIHHYDTYVPILSDLEQRRSWTDACRIVLDALRPLGTDYCTALERGLTGRWCDRYPNQGKQSGAFSCGSYDGDPYILMNYKPQVLNDVFTLAHEAGHSMHSHYSAANQPFETYNYTIFVAEVASTFNEQLLTRHLLDQAADKRERAYLINHEIDDIRATVYRQTMFAEFEKIVHETAEAGEPITLAVFRDVYRGLLEKYFGPDFQLDDELSLECLRIPHFYRAFYVYKYATGMSAAIALCQRVLTGGAAELEAYMSFLKGGCSKDPLDLLRDAGVDMERPKPIQTALKHFAKRVAELEELLG